MSDTKVNCIRCYFGDGKKASDEIQVGYGDSRYALDLCGKHAAEFDDIMWGWLRAAREVINDNFAGKLTMTEHHRLSPAHIPEPVRRPVPMPKPVVVSKTEMEDVLLAAEHPQRTHMSRNDNGEGLWVHYHDRVIATVNRETREVVTVAGPAQFSQTA
jgi:hypothetical protein